MGGFLRGIEGRRWCTLSHGVRFSVQATSLGRVPKNWVGLLPFRLSSEAMTYDEVGGREETGCRCLRGDSRKLRDAPKRPPSAFVRPFHAACASPEGGSTHCIGD